jgi:GWxTD domain-containing protein
MLTTSIITAQDPGATRQNAAQSLVLLADSLAGQGDTARAIEMLESAVKRDRRDAPAWFRLGLMQWEQAKPGRGAWLIPDQRTVRLLMGADSALRLATQFAPDSARFWNALSEFNLTSGNPSLMTVSRVHTSRAIQAAVKTHDTLQLALAHNAAGRGAWRRYEPLANRSMVQDNRPVDLTILTIPLPPTRRDAYIDYLRSIAKRIEPPAGEGDYQAALNHFQRALEANPTNQRIARDVYMALGEKSRWQELLVLAGDRSRRYPFDHQAQLARGLAANRLGRGQEAQAAFDSALVLMDEAERGRMTALSRILRPTAYTEELRASRGVVTTADDFERLPTAQRQAMADLYWLVADPLALTPDNEYRNEYLARFTWADLRWTIEETGVRGADTDRGDVFIRFGPPTEEMTIAGNSSGDTMGAGVTIVWFYDRNLAFFFDLMPGYRSAYTAPVDKPYTDRLKFLVPVRWANLPSTHGVDTIPLRITRFRGGGDSMDVVIAGKIPVDSMLRGVPMDRVPLDIDLRIFDPYARVHRADSARVWVMFDSLRAPLPRSWVRRVGPGLNILRVEALQADTRRAARTIARIEEDHTRGFGMSDLLLGSAPELKGDAIPRGWRDVHTSPSSGTFSHSQVGLVWELYELAAQDGQARYQIELTVERVTKGLARFTASIVDGLGRTLGREQRGVNDIRLSFARVVPAAPLIVEYLTVNLVNAAPGEYRLQVTTIEHETQRRASRTTSFWIR